jgi:rubrerythrin
MEAMGASVADKTRLLETERYLAHAGKIRLDDVPWDEGARVGLTRDEVFTLGYFADIEGQTLRYLKQLLAMHDALEDDVAAFLTTWNYEEFFHGRAFEKLLALTGHARGDGQKHEVARAARLNEWIERTVGPLLGRLLPRQLPAVYLSFGAVQELTTLRGYESIAARTQNPALRLVAERIAKQERRHFTWYFQRAEARLASDPLAQRLTRFLLEHNWVPVGAGVKSDAEVRRLFHVLFPNGTGAGFASEVDAKIGSLAGLHGIRLLRAYMASELAREAGPGRPLHGRALRARLRGEERDFA